MKLRYLVVILLLLLTGCSDEKTEGYILEATDGRILLAENIASEEYEEIKGKTIEELDREGISLIYLAVDDNKNLQQGDHVEAWIRNGNVDESFPAQATATRIEIIN